MSNLTNKDKSERKERFTIRWTILILAILVMLLIYVRSLVGCGDDIILLCNENDIIYQCNEKHINQIEENKILLLYCDSLETILILSGAALGALFGFEVQRHEKRNNKNNTQSEQ